MAIAVLQFRGAAEHVVVERHVRQAHHELPRVFDRQAAFSGHVLFKLGIKGGQRPCAKYGSPFRLWEQMEIPCSKTKRFNEQGNCGLGYGLGALQIYLALFA